MKKLISVKAVLLGAAVFIPVSTVSSATGDPPWHLADIWWAIPPETPTIIQSLSIDFTVEGDIPPDVNIYIAPMGGVYFKEDRGLFYGGVQSSAVPPGVPVDRTINCAATKSTTRGIFSRWGPRDLTATIPAEPDGVFCESDAENDFVSVRRPVSWKAGSYSLIVSRTGGPSTAGQMWLEMKVADKRTGRETSFGKLRVPDKPITKGFASFLEIFGGGRAPAGGLNLKVTFENVQLNGKPIEPLCAKVIFNEKTMSAPPIAEAKSVRPGEIQLDVSKLRDRSALPKSGGDSYQIIRWSKSMTTCPFLS